MVGAGPPDLWSSTTPDADTIAKRGSQLTAAFRMLAAYTGDDTTVTSSIPIPSSTASRESVIKFQERQVDGVELKELSLPGPPPPSAPVAVATTTQQPSQQSGGYNSINLRIVAEARRVLHACIEKEARLQHELRVTLAQDYQRTQQALEDASAGFAAARLPRDKIARRKLNTVRRMYSALRASAKRYYALLHATVFRDLRHHIQYIRRAAEDPNLAPEARPLVQGLLSDLDALGQRAVRQLTDLAGGVAEVNFAPQLKELDEDEIDDVKAARDGAIDEIMSIVQRTNSLFLNQQNLGDMIMDNQFMLLYGIKLLRILFLYAALVIALRVFEQMYLNGVYVQNKEPPSILTMLGLFLAFDVALNLALLLFMLVLVFFFKTSGNAFLIDMSLIRRMVTDYVATMVIVGAIGAIIGSIVQRKKYFKYNVEGPRAIRAYKEMLFSAGAIITLIPFSLLI
jgi:hypothetical protein